MIHNHSASLRSSMDMKLHMIFFHTRVSMLHNDHSRYWHVHTEDSPPMASIIGLDDYNTIFIIVMGKIARLK